MAPGLIKPRKTQRLPDIITVEEAQRVFAATRTLSYRVIFFTLYSLGLRLGEGLRLEVGDIDAERGRVNIRDAKGNRDRLVPLPRATLNLLREFWQVHRNPVLLFPNRQSGLKGAAAATTPLDRGWRRSNRGAEVPGPSLHSDHRSLYPPDRPDQASRNGPYQRSDGRFRGHLGESQMIRLATIIDTFETELLANYRSQLRSEHYRALAGDETMPHAGQPHDAGRMQRVRAAQTGAAVLRPAPLPALSAPRQSAMAGTADKKAGACRVFFTDFYPAGGIQRDQLGTPECRLRTADALRLADGTQL